MRMATKVSIDEAGEKALLQMLQVLKSRGVKDDGHHYFQEIIVFSDNLLHVFLRGRKNNEHVVTFVCRKSANVGMVLTKTRLALPTIESSV